MSLITPTPERVTPLALGPIDTTTSFRNQAYARLKKSHRRC